MINVAKTRFYSKDVENLSSKKKRYLRYAASLYFVFSQTCLVSYAIAADLRQREANNIVVKSGTTSMSKSANGTDVVNIANPNSGNSVNTFSSFDVGTNNGVILNNSQTKTTSKIDGGTVEANKNLRNQAKLITVDVQSKAISKINGQVEVVGQRADVIIANENGLSMNGAGFINTNGVSAVAGKVNDRKARIEGVGKVEILDKGVAVDGDYFNVVARSVKTAGSVKHSKNGKALKNVNYIVGNNEVDLSNGKAPKITGKTNVSSKIDGVAIEGTSLGSVHGENVQFISTEEGMGVKHKGMITSTEQILLMANGDIETDTLISKNIKVETPTHTYKNTNKVAATNVSIKSKNVENIGDIYSKKLDIEAKDSVKNFGIMGAETDLTITAKTITNEGKRTAGSGITGIVGDTISSNGYVGYGDTAFKTWTTGLSYTTYSYEYNAEADDFTPAKMIANNIVLKADTINNKGVIYGDSNVDIKGSLNNLTLTTNKSIADLLNGMKLTGPLTSKEYLGAWNTNGTTYFNSGTSMLTVLKDLANSNWKDHQKEAIYNAIKDAANKDPNLKQALEMLLGKDYAGKRFIPSVDSWNQDAKLAFVPADKKSGIYSNKTLNISGDKIVSGIDVDVSKNLAYLVGKYTTTREMTSQPKPETPKLPIIKVDGESEKGLAVIKANNDITIQANNVLNELSSIISKLGKVVYKVNDTFEGKDSEVSGNSVEITSGNVKDEGGVYNGKETLVITASKDIDIKGSNLSAKDIRLTSTGGNVKIGATQEVRSAFKQTVADNSQFIESEIVKTSVGSSLIANTIVIVADKLVDFVGSNAEAVNEFLAQAQKVNIEDSINEYTYAGNGRSVGLNAQGIIQVDTVSTASNSLISNGSSIKAGAISLVGSNELNIKGSSLNSAGDMILMGNNVNIIDGRNVVQSDSFTTAFNPLGYKDEKNEVYTSTYSASTLNSGNNLNIKGNYVGITGADITSVGATNIAGNEVKLAAAENIVQAQTTKSAFGLTAGASAGIAGYGASASYSAATETTNTDIYNGNQANTNNLIKAEIGVEFTRTINTMDKFTYLNSNIQGDNIDIVSKGVLDFGGANLLANNDINLEGFEVKTTKYTDRTSTASDGFSLYAKQTIETSSILAGLANTISQDVQASNNGKNLQAGIVFAQYTSQMLNLIFGDLISNTSSQRVGFKLSHTNSKLTQENITNIAANGNLNVKSTSGDINLNGVYAGANNTALNSAGDINVRSAVATSSGFGYDINAEVALQEKAAVSAYLGAKNDYGLAMSAGLSIFENADKKHTNSILSTKNNMLITSAKNTNIVGGNIEANNIDLNVKDLSIASALDTSYSKNFGASITGTAVVGMATNTLFTGGVSATGYISYNESKSNTVGKQSGLIAKNTLNGNVKGNANLVAAVVGGSSGDLKIAGTTAVKNLNIFEKSGGTSISIGGRTNAAVKSVTADINIDNHIEKTGVLKTGIGIALNGTFEHGFNKDISNTLNLSDKSWQGGRLNTKIIFVDER